MKLNHLSAVAMVAFLAGGCANIPSVGPDYHAPATKTQSHWNEPLAGGETNSAAVTAARWKNFHDAELDSLVTRAVIPAQPPQVPVGLPSELLLRRPDVNLIALYKSLGGGWETISQPVALASVETTK